MNKLALSSILLTCFVSTFTSAQQLKQFDDMLTQQTHQQLSAKYTVMQDPQIVKARAKSIRALYEALLSEGFSKDEALTLVAASLRKD